MQIVKDSQWRTVSSSVLMFLAIMGIASAASAQNRDFRHHFQDTPPSITAQPASETITAGQAATFTVTASGSGILSYQWSQNGTAISGATSSSFTTPAESSSANGEQFTVTVSNSDGTVTSNAATLTVNPVTVAPGTLSSSASALPFGSVNVGSNSILSVTFTNTGSSDVTLSSVTVNGAGFTGSGISAGQTLTPGQAAALNVTFAPSAGGSVSGASVTVTSNASDPSLTVALTGTGVTVAAAGTLSSSASALPFGSVNVGSNSILSVTFTNTGSSDVTLSSVTVNGAGFTGSGISAGQTLTPGQAAALNVTFAPSAGGSVSGASVTVTSNASDPSLTVALTGTGVSATASSVVLSWDDSASNLAGYDVYRSNSFSGPFTTPLNSAPVTTTQYVDSGVVSGQTYYYVVTAVDDSSDQSADSNVATVTIP